MWRRGEPMGRTACGEASQISKSGRELAVQYCNLRCCNRQRCNMRTHWPSAASPGRVDWSCRKPLGDGNRLDSVAVRVGLFVGTDMDVTERHSHGEILLWWSVRIRRCANRARKAWTQSTHQLPVSKNGQMAQGDSFNRLLAELAAYRHCICLP